MAAGDPNFTTYMCHTWGHLNIGCWQWCTHMLCASIQCSDDRRSLPHPVSGGVFVPSGCIPDSLRQRLSVGPFWGSPQKTRPTSTRASGPRRREEPVQVVRPTQCRPIQSHCDQVHAQRNAFTNNVRDALIGLCRGLCAPHGRTPPVPRSSSRSSVTSSPAASSLSTWHSLTRYRVTPQ